MATRERLPDRRKSWTQKVRIPDGNGAMQTFYLSAGHYPDGRPGEVWLEAHKEGTFVRGILQALARTASLALQFGVPVEEVVSALRHLNFPPRGEVEGSAAVRSCSSLPDWIAQELEAAYLRPAPALVGPAPTEPNGHGLVTYPGDGDGETG